MADLPPQGSLKRLRTLFAVWGLTGVGAVAGSMLGARAGKAWLMDGGLAGGVFGLAIAVTVAARRGWLPLKDRPGALLGGLVGFSIAAPIAMANLHTPVTPVAVTGLVGVGALFGIGVWRGFRGNK